MTHKLYKGSHAAAILGITRDGFYKAIARYPLEPEAIIDDKQAAWTRESLINWYAAIPPQGRKGKKMNQLYTLTTQGNRDNGTRLEKTAFTGTLQEILAEIDSNRSDRTADLYFSEPDPEGKGGFIWWDDHETSFKEDGGEDAINISDDEEYPEYAHKSKKPLTTEGLENYAKTVMDVHSAIITPA